MNILNSLKDWSKKTMKIERKVSIKSKFSLPLHILYFSNHHTNTNKREILRKIQGDLGKKMEELKLSPDKLKPIFNQE